MLVGGLPGFVARSEDGATWIGVVFTMATVMLGGTFFEVAKGSVLSKFGVFSINTYANEAFRTVINQTGGFTSTWPQLAVLGAVIIVGFSIARLLFRAVPGGK